MAQTTKSATTSNIKGDDSHLTYHTPTMTKKESSLVYNNTMTVNAGLGALDGSGEGYFPHGSGAAAKEILQKG